MNKCTNQWVKQTLLLAKSHLISTVSNCNWEVPKRVTEFVKQQPHGWSNQLLSVKSIKIEKEKGACHIKLF